MKDGLSMFCAILRFDVLFGCKSLLYWYALQHNKCHSIRDKQQTINFSFWSNPIIK